VSGEDRAADVNAGRRHFLIGLGVVGAGTAAGIYVAPELFARSGAGRAAGTPPVDFKPHAFVRISSDDTITAIIGKSEMGQGIHTGIPMVLAEELDVNPQRLAVEIAGVDPVFNHPFLPAQFTGGSMSQFTTYEALRQVGATARAMLIAAAAARWNVDPASLRTEDGVVTDGSRRASYGALAEAASKLPAPAKDTVRLKDPRDFRYIGKPQKRLDNRVKVTGQAVFGSDVDLPDMLVAVVARAPVHGAAVRSFDDKAARAVPGVVEVKQVPSGVAVLAKHTWAALKGRDALVVDWDARGNDRVSTNALRDAFRALSSKPGAVGENTGDVDKALAGAAKTLEVEYEFPYLAHACMEPMNATVHVTPGRCEIWAPTQQQSQDAQAAAAALGIPPAAVTLHTTFLGGGFGRRASGDSDFVVEATHVANGAGRPVKVIWTREDDMREGHYRPYTINRVRGGIGADGLPVAYHHVNVAQSILMTSPLAKGMVKNGLDPASIEGSMHAPYAIPNRRVETHIADSPVSILWWRSVGNSYTGFVLNAAIDELAALAGRDPYDYRRALLAGKPRHLAVLDKAAAAAGWGKPLPAGRFHGIALHESFQSIVAQVAEVSVQGSDVRVHRVTCAVDCGLAVNPDQVVAQIQSGVVYGLCAALHGEITVEAGRSVQGNFDTYPVLRIAEAPAIDVHIVPSDGKMGGIGEPGTPPIAPAVCGAIFAATGKRIRRLPISAALA
jgi:isoquinoline 1-oxidoreductase beta subunit